MASQQHGKTWEEDIVRRVFGVTAVVPYTSAYDIPRDLNSLTSEPVSIKTRWENGEICMGDALRTYDREADVLDIWVTYSQNGDHKEIREVAEVRLPHAALWGEVTREEVRHLTALTKDRTVPMMAVHAEKKRLNAKSGLLQFRPKRDSKNQQRLQCAFPKAAVQTCLEKHALSRSAEGILRGIQLVLQISSTRRLRHPRV